jgi:hypothetical protein
MRKTRLTLHPLIGTPSAFTTGTPASSILKSGRARRCLRSKESPVVERVNHAGGQHRIEHQ